MISLFIICTLLSLYSKNISSQYICTNADRGTRDFHFHGTALGGFLVLEPWLTPSLFYQFLALGAEEANRQLRLHWDSWVTEEHILNLSKMGIDTVRIPIADWMYIPYEPFIGCWDGALEQLQRVIDLCRKYNLNVMLDLHAMRDSQNGLDNSGVTANLEWIGYFSRDNVTRYRHWDIRSANWPGKFNTTSGRYDSINMANIAYSIAVVAEIVERHHADPAVVALEPVNEPSDTIPLDLLKHFYWEAYSLVQARAPHWITVFHDSFRLTPENWVDFMPGCPNYAFDSHIYQAWADDAEMAWFQDVACKDGNRLRAMESLGIPVIVGEWSLAVDNCAMWLNGLNDNVWGYPKVQCEMVPCPDPYFGLGQIPNAPPDPTKGAQDPFGTGASYVMYGQCPRDHFLEHEDRDMRALTLAKLYAFDLHTHGQFFWNFRTEFEPRWDFMQAVQRGWMPARGISRARSSPESRRLVHSQALQSCNVSLTAAIVENGPGPDGTPTQHWNHAHEHEQAHGQAASVGTAQRMRTRLLGTTVCASLLALVLVAVLGWRRGRGGRSMSRAGSGYRVIADPKVSHQAAAAAAAAGIPMAPVSASVPVV